MTPLLRDKPAINLGDSGGLHYGLNRGATDSAQLFNTPQPEDATPARLALEPKSTALSSAICDLTRSIHTDNCPNGTTSRAVPSDTMTQADSAPAAPHASDQKVTTAEHSAPPGHLPDSSAGALATEARPYVVTDVATWGVRVFVFSYPASVNSRVELPIGNATIFGHGDAELSPGDPDVPDVGRRIAVSRALRDLADTLAFRAGNDIVGLRNRAREEHVAPAGPG